MAVRNHIRHPLEWTWDQVRAATHGLESSAQSIRGDRLALAAPPRVRRIAAGDLRDALMAGLRDFGACRTDVIFLCLLYPLAGLVLARLAMGHDMVPLIFPLASGFALIGPVAAAGLYEMSRRRELGEDVSWYDAFGVVLAPALGPMIVLGLVLGALFVAWLYVADAIYTATLGPQPPASIAGFIGDVLTTPAGWAMIAIGCGVGFVFAVIVLSISVVSFPLLIDRHVGLWTAVATSLRAVAKNPGPMLLWGFIVASGLVLGAIPLLIGLAITVPVLGHATWHLYRRVVE